MEPKINAIIVDDEVKSGDVLNKMLLHYCPDINVVGIANSVYEAAKLTREKKPELLFLDIQLPDGNGFNLLQQLNMNVKVIFTTAYEEYALQALKCAAVDYLLKPINIDELVIAVEKCRIQTNIVPGSVIYDMFRDNFAQSKNKKLKTIGLSTVNEIVFVAIDQIIRLEAASNYTHFFMDNGEKITVSHTLGHYEDILAECSFLRVHQSHIINLGKVKKYIKGKGGQVMMSDGQCIDISPRNKEELLRALNYI